MAMNPREIEDTIAREVLGWVFARANEPGYSSVYGPGWYSQDEDGYHYVGWPEAWATDMDAMWKLATRLANDGIVWQLNTMKDGQAGSFVELDYLPDSLSSYHETVEAEAGPDQMPLAMCLALLEMEKAKKAKTADGLKTV